MAIFKMLRVSGSLPSGEQPDSLILDISSHRLYHGNQSGMPDIIADPNHNHDGVYVKFLGLLTTDPVTANAGDIYINNKNTPSIVKIYDGKAWIAHN